MEEEEYLSDGEIFFWRVVGIIASMLILPFVLMLVSYFKEPPTNTTMHQPDPTEQYADSLVCPD